MKKWMLSILASALVTTGLVAQNNYPDAVVIDNRITEDTTLTADTVWKLDGYTFVLEPATLTIEPGTLIVAETGQAENASALVITRDARIVANGTPDAPIIMTSVLDPQDGSVDETATGLWGGLVIMGEAPLNSAGVTDDTSEPITDQIEGFILPDEDLPLITFGGNNAADDSGSLSYVSVRHGGIVIGTSNEINGISFGGVGSETEVSHIEVFANQDDGVEFFGGTVDAKYISLAFNYDDSVDYDQGYVGRLQHIFVIQKDNSFGDNDFSSDKAGELDGQTADNGLVVGGTSIYNATMIGIGNTVDQDGNPADGNRTFTIRDNAIARIYNSIFVDYETFVGVESDNAERVAAGDVVLSNNLWWSHIPDNNTVASFVSATASELQSDVTDIIANGNNVIADPQLMGINRNKGSNALDPRPSSASDAWTMDLATPPNDGFYDDVDWAGAFGSDLWIAGWSVLDELGYLATATASVSDRFENLSTRGTVGETDDESLIGGLIIPSDGEITVLVRGRGPSLADEGFTGEVLSDPNITVVRQSDGEVIATNDNWGDSSTASLISGTQYEPGDAADAALVLEDLPGGAYTVIVRGTGGATGTAIVEAFDVDLN
ncbi:MAG: hypothetical protein ACFE0O_15955 [Opitutales bacterium]